MKEFGKTARFCRFLSKSLKINQRQRFIVVMYCLLWAVILSFMLSILIILLSSRNEGNSFAPVFERCGGTSYASAFRIIRSGRYVCVFV